MANTQTNRLLELATPLGEDVLRPQTLYVQEAISALFRINLQLYSDEDAIDPGKIVGQNVTIRLWLTDAPEEGNRYFNGFVSRFSQGGSDERFTYYSAEVVPWLWFLTRTADCYIFQDLTVPDILTKVFQKHGFHDFRSDGLTRSYTKWDYCVQYRETAFNFVSRLMEQEGIFYFFEHEDGKHTLVLGDAPGAHEPCPDQSRVRYLPDDRREPGVTAWQMTTELRPGQYALRDYHFEMPTKTLEVTQPTINQIGSNGALEVYDYPGAYAQKFNKPTERLSSVEPEGRQIVKLHMEEEETPYQIMEGSSSCRAFSAGYRFDLTDHPRRAVNGAYVLTSVQHMVTQSGDTNYAVSGSGTAPASYHNSFLCIPHRVPFRPPRVTPKPVVQGPQTAVVTGKDGEEIWVDKYGRVKVQFHWDRENPPNEQSSCWIRVAQNWAGKRWGIIFTPRIGQEVIVDFLEGDPDQPIITGRVYNAEEMPPYTLPAEQTKSTIKSNSSKGGGGFNEFRFEDAKSKEQVFLHAERDMDNRVKNDSREWIGNDRHLIVKANQREFVEADKHSHVQGKHLEKIDSDMSLQVGGKRNTKVGTVDATEAGMEIHLKAGMKIIIEAGMQVSIKGPGGFIDIGPAGVTIQGILVNINSGGAAGSGSGSSPEDPQDPDVADDGTKTGKLN